MLDRYFPGIKDKYVKKYGYAYSLMSGNDPQLMEIFVRTCEKHGIMHDVREIFAYLKTFETKARVEQLSLF
jgi:hypothetical protein